MELFPHYNHCYIQSNKYKKIQSQRTIFQKKLTRCFCAKYCNNPPARRKSAGARSSLGDVYK